MQQIDRIIFFGTPLFAATILEALILQKRPIVAVVTAPDKAAGRGLKAHTSAVKQIAEKYNLPVLQPEKLKSEDFHSELKSFNADLFIVVAFRMLPEMVWSMPPLGSV
ncbi:MAG: methionyl-tRNA formyltransferase, partial [Bacteroidia bacterium]